MIGPRAEMRDRFAMGYKYKQERINTMGHQMDGVQTKQKRFNRLQTEAAG